MIEIDQKVSLVALEFSQTVMKEFAQIRSLARPLASMFVIILRTGHEKGGAGGPLIASSSFISLVLVSNL